MSSQEKIVFRDTGLGDFFLGALLGRALHDHSPEELKAKACNLIDVVADMQRDAEVAYGVTSLSETLERRFGERVKPNPPPSAEGHACTRCARST